MKITVRKISQGDVSKISSVYKEVFAGFPWYEERVCSGILQSNEEEKCKIQYTAQRLPKSYQWQLDLTQRTGVVGNANGLESCVACGRTLISFYPDFINQKDLIKEALNADGFIGYLLEDKQTPIGFSWGFRVPTEKRTKSVNFPLIAPMLNSAGINLEKAFYGSELGIIERMQGSGKGLLASALRLRDARLQNYEYLTVRTKNDKVLSILRKIFTGQKGRLLFLDPQRSTPWYAWQFKTFDDEGVSKLIFEQLGT